MRKLTIYRQFFTRSDCYRKGTIQRPQGIQVHSTGANAPFLKRYVQPDDGRLGTNKYNNSHNRGGVDVCANAYIGKLADGKAAVYQTLPWDYRCWLSGSGSNGSANRNGYIGFEICEDGLTDKEYFQSAVLGLSVSLVAYLCLQYDIPLSNVHDHKELYGMGLASNHADIQHWLKKFGMTMDDYREMVAAAMNEGVQVTYIEGDTVVGEEQAEEETIMYTAKVVANNKYDVRMRQEPSTSAGIEMYVPQGAIVDVYEDVNAEWSKIGYDTRIGYMMREFLDPIELDDPPVEPEPTPEPELMEVEREQLEDIKRHLEELLEEVNALLNT